MSVERGGDGKGGVNGCDGGIGSVVVNQSREGVYNKILDLCLDVPCELRVVLSNPRQCVAVVYSEKNVT